LKWYIIVPVPYEGLMTVFSIAWSTFRMYCVMGIFKSSIVWGLFKYTEVFFNRTETFDHSVYAKDVKKEWRVILVTKNSEMKAERKK
jgi:hypothetical protein